MKKIRLLLLICSIAFMGTQIIPYASADIICQGGNGCPTEIVLWCEGVLVGCPVNGYRANYAGGRAYPV